MRYTLILSNLFVFDVTIDYNMNDLVLTTVTFFM